MKTKTSISANACAPGALPGGLVRTRFFDGMFLTQADLENEQRFWRVKRRLTNRALGAGVVWGLKLAWRPERRSFALSPGYALDCCGNDLIVECPVEVTERELWERADPSLRAPSKNQLSTTATINAARGPRHACVVLQYVECAEESRPIHRDACGGTSTSCEPSRIRETARLVLVPPPAAPPPSPPELFWAELIAWRDALPADVRDALFPAQTTPPPVPQTGDVPLTVHVRVPGTAGAPAGHGTMQPRLGTTVFATPSVISSNQTFDPGRPSGVVTFELVPSANWGFTSGTVQDAGRVVETVTPPLAMSMYWSFDGAAPAAGSPPVTSLFEFDVADLGLAESFGTRHGTASFTISGEVTISNPANQQVTVTVTKLQVVTTRADVIEGGPRGSCFADAVPWGWAVDPADGSRIARVLLLSTMYAALSELVQRGASPQWIAIARLLYLAVWRAMFGVDPLAPLSSANERYRRELVGFLIKLYERWCAGFAYPGPRCADEHHGVYLGCVEIAANGAISSFDMWEGRRYVLTGPLVSHWAGLFGIAPLDVIVGRFASAICCLSGQPLLLPPGRGVGTTTANGFELGRNVAVGDPASVAVFARNHKAEVRWASPGDLVRGVLGAMFGADGGGGREVLALGLRDGGTIAVAVPSAATAGTLSTGPSTGGGAGRDRVVADDVTSLLRRGPARVPARARASLAALATNVIEAAPASSIIDPAGPEAMARLAKRLDDGGITVGGLLADGADAALARVGLRGNELVASRNHADVLVDRAELAVDAVAGAVATLAASFDPARATDPDTVKRATDAIRRAFGGRLAPEVVATALSRIART